MNAEVKRGRAGRNFHGDLSYTWGFSCRADRVSRENEKKSDGKTARRAGARSSLSRGYSQVRESKRAGGAGGGEGEGKTVDYGYCAVRAQPGKMCSAESGGANRRQLMSRGGFLTAVF